MSVDGKILNAIITVHIFFISNILDTNKQFKWTVLNVNEEAVE